MQWRRRLRKAAPVKNAQVTDGAARRVLCQIEGKARQATRGQAVGIVADACGSCACGNESRAPDDCAVVEREPDWTGEGFSNCATALAGWKHREGHLEGTTEARGRAGCGWRRRERRDGRPRRQRWPEAWEKIMMTGCVLEAASWSEAWAFIPQIFFQNFLRIRLAYVFFWPAGACGALRRRAGGHRPPRRRRGRPQDHCGDQFCLRWIARATYTKTWAASPPGVGAPMSQTMGVGTARRWKKQIIWAFSWLLSAWFWHCKRHTRRGVRDLYEAIKIQQWSD